MDSSTAGEAALSCQDDADHLCTYYQMIPAGAQATDCPSPDTVVGACATVNVVATCSYNSGGTDQTITWYMGVSGSTAALKSTCDSLSGTFTTN